MTHYLFPETQRGGSADIGRPGGEDERRCAEPNLTANLLSQQPGAEHFKAVDVFTSSVAS